MAGHADDALTQPHRSCCVYDLRLLGLALALMACIQSIAVSAGAIDNSILLEEPFGHTCEDATVGDTLLRPCMSISQLYDAQSA